MNAHRNCIVFPCLALALNLTAPLVQSATVFETHFDSTDGYTIGALNNANWTVTNAGANTEWIVGAETQNPSIPTSLGASASHPTSPSGSNQLLWLSPQTSVVSANQVALLSFATTKLREPFKVSYDLFASPTGGAGQSITMHLARDDSPTATTAPRLSFTSIGTSTMSLNVWDNGTATNSVATLPKNSWLRFEIAVEASSISSLGTYTVSVLQLDASGSVTSTLYSSEALDYNLSAGFNSLRFLTNSSRTDYWIDSFTVSTIPEPGTVALLAGSVALLAAIRLRRR